MKKNVDKHKYKIPFVHYKLRNIYRSLRSIIQKPERPLQKLIESSLTKNNHVFFVQIGSNDGLYGDPIRDLILKYKNWNGIFIEPVFYLFNRLKRNYKEEKRFIFENVAVGTKNELRDFYYLSENDKLRDEIGPWYDQLGSFDKQHITKHLKDVDIEPYIFTEKVRCMPLNEILVRNKVTKIDLLHIDTEGFDYKILTQVDFTRYKPLAILYEHKHLSIDETERAELLLKNHGYNVIRMAKDTVATIKSLKS